MNVESSEWVAGDAEHAYTLPSRYYYDQDIFEREKQAIFYKGWHLAAHKNELADPGQFVTCDIFDQNVLVVCGRDGALRAFHNVCQHRGNRLMKARRGKVPAVFTCGYHAWTYGLDGGFRSAPRSERVTGFDMGACGLKPVRVEVFAGFVFVNLDPEALAVGQLCAGAEVEIRRHCPDLDDLTFHSETDFIVPVNWKVIMDNAIEGYHFARSGPVHQALTDLIAFEQYDLRAHGAWWSFMSPSKPGLSKAFGAELGDATYQSDRFFNLALWPHMIVYCFPYADFFGTFLMIPMAAEKTCLRLGYYVPRRDMPEVTRACIKWMNEDLGPEDIELNISVQQGLRSFGYDRGRYMIDAERSNESEHLLHHFHGLVHAAVAG